MNSPASRSVYSSARQPKCLPAHTKYPFAMAAAFPSMVHVQHSGSLGNLKEVSRDL